MIVILFLCYSVEEHTHIHTTYIYCFCDLGGNPPKDIGSKSKRPILPKHSSFSADYRIPKKKTCRFDREWFKKYPWIAYSASANNVCFACIYFTLKEDRFPVKSVGNRAYLVGNKNKGTGYTWKM